MKSKDPTFPSLAEQYYAEQYQLRLQPVVSESSPQRRGDRYSRQSRNALETVVNSTEDRTRNSPTLH